MLDKRSRLQWIIQILLESATCCISKWICGEQSCGPENQEKELRDTKVFRIAERKWRVGDTYYFDPLLIVFLVVFFKKLDNAALINEYFHHSACTPLLP